MRKVYQCEHTVPPVWWFTLQTEMRWERKL